MAKIGDRAEWSGPTGIGGWLALLRLNLVLLGPYFGYLRLNVDLMTTEIVKLVQFI